MANVNNMSTINPLRVEAMRLYSQMEEGRIPRASEYDASKEGGGYKVRSLTQAEHFCNRTMLAGRGQSYYVSALIIEGKHKVSRTIVSRPWCRETPYIPVKRKAVMTTNVGTPQVVERYSEYYLHVFFPEDPQEIGGLLEATIVKDRSGDFWWNVGGAFHNIISRRQYPGDEAELLENGLIYGAFDGSVNTETMTAGEAKRYMLPFVAKNHEQLHVPLKYLMTAGASLALMSGEDATPKQMAQANNRLSQPDAPATPMAVVECAGFFFGKIKNSAGEEYRDGFGFVSAEWWARILTIRSLYKKVFSPSSVQGMLLQARPAMWKAMAEVVAGEYLSEFIYRRGMEVVTFVQSEMTDEEVADFQAGCQGNGPLNDKLVILCSTQEVKDRVDAGDYGAVEIFTDRNGNKAPFDPVMPIVFTLLSVSHPCKDIKHGAHLSTQVLQTLFAADKKAAMRFATHAFRRELESKMALLDEETVKTPSITDLLSESTNMSQLLVQMCPAVATKWYFPLLKSVTENTVTGLCRDAQNLSITTEGLYQKIITDPAMDFGVNLLGINQDGEMEVLCPGAEKAGYSRGVAIKYPKQHHREYGKCRIITVQEYCERVENCPQLLSYEKKLLVDKIRHLSTGGIILPAIELIKNMLAGLDFDGDALILYLDNVLCDIVWEWKKGSPLAVVIKDGEPMPSEVEVTAAV